MDLTREEKCMEHDGDTNYNGYTRNNPQKFSKGIGRVGIRSNNITQIRQNTEKSPGDSR